MSHNMKMRIKAYKIKIEKKMKLKDPKDAMDGSRNTVSSSSGTQLSRGTGDYKALF